jgi:hypothetical protein
MVRSNGSGRVYLLADRGEWMGTAAVAILASHWNSGAMWLAGCELRGASRGGQRPRVRSRRLGREAIEEADDSHGCAVWWRDSPWREKEERRGEKGLERGRWTLRSRLTRRDTSELACRRE